MKSLVAVLVYAVFLAALIWLYVRADRWLKKLDEKKRNSDDDGNGGES